MLPLKLACGSSPRIAEKSQFFRQLLLRQSRLKAQLLDFRLGEQGGRQRIAEGDALDGKIRGVDQETVGGRRHQAGHRTRNVGHLTGRRPAAQGVYVIGLAGIRRLHQAAIDAVINFPAGGPGEEQAGVNALPGTGGGQGAVSDGNTAAEQVLAGGRERGIVGDVLAALDSVAGRIFPVGPVELLSRRRVRSRATGQIEGIDGLPFPDEEIAADDVAAVTGELEHLVGEAGSDEGDVPVLALP